MCVLRVTEQVTIGFYYREETCLLSGSCCVLKYNSG